MKRRFDSPAARSGQDGSRSFSGTAASARGAACRPETGGEVAV